MFPLAETAFAFNPNDLSANNPHDYESTDFFSDGTFIDSSFDDTSFMNVVMSRTMGGALPFIFQPDGDNPAVDQWAICEFDQNAFEFEQVAHNVYNISLKIREVW